MCFTHLNPFFESKSCCSESLIASFVQLVICIIDPVLFLAEGGSLRSLTRGVELYQPCSNRSFSQNDWTNFLALHNFHGSDDRGVWLLQVCTG